MVLVIVGASLTGNVVIQSDATGADTTGILLRRDRTHDVITRDGNGKGYRRPIQPTEATYFSVFQCRLPDTRAAFPTLDVL